MNLTIDAQRPVSGSGSTENTTTTYKPSAHTQGTGTVSRSGYTLDIADKVMDNEAYGGHGLTAEDIMQQAANSNAQSKKDFMIVMSSCVSGEDLQRMQEEGFQPGCTDVETYVTIVDRIKVTLAQAGVEVAGYNDGLDVETIEQITGSRVDANSLIKQLSDALQKSDIPVTNDNIAELVSAVLEASGIGELSEDAVKYLVVNGKAPTIENMYKAQYSSAESIRQSQGYYSDGAGNSGRYYAKKADDINWDNLEQKIDSVVKQAGLDTDTDTKAQAVENAKWLVTNGIELNAKNLAMVTDLKNLSLPMDQSDIADMCVTAMENGKAPAQADMTGESSIAQQAHEIMEQAANISDEAVHETVESGKEINIKNLAEAQRQIDAHTASNVDAEKASADNKGAEILEEESDVDAVDETALKEVQARRQLEEIRLMMTEEANRHLLRAGISVDTTELSKLVEALKAAENNIRSILFQGENAAQNEQRALIYEETISRTKELAGMPAAVLGKLLSKIPQSTLLHIHEAGRELENQLNEQNQNENNGSASQNQQGKASAAYETLMTEPRKDLGDRISKAFRNIDDILTDMGLETSESNRRAVRILGYNSMDISEENINAVKAADSQVTGVISRMTPATTLQMIREQKNPLEMTMKELEAYLDSRDSEPAADAEKYSRFLQRLDRSNGISQDEREAYIGIYRMFRQIEKSDGAVIGSLVATGAQVNFKNMLSAVRTAADKNMDVRVDDGFGGLENLITKGKAIDAQIQAGYQNRSGSESQQQTTEDTAAQEKYYARLSGEINDELAQNTDFDKLNTAEISGETTIEQFAETVKNTQVSENSEVRVKEKAEDLKRFQSDMHEVEQIDEQIINTLVDYGQVINVDNIQAASMLIFDRGSVFSKVIRQDAKGADSAKETDAQDSELPESDGLDSDVLKQADTFVENLTDAKQADISYQEIISEANKAVEHMIYENASSHIDVKAAKALYKGLALAGNLAKEENYEIPMDIDGELTSVNLKIYRNASQTGKVAVTFDTDKFGKVAAEFDVTEKRISGMVVYENRAGKAELEQLEQTVTQELGSAGNKQVSISLVQTKSVDLNKFGQDRDVNSSKDTKISTGELYRTAKAFLTALKKEK
ncbi:MAG: hypothetical protein K2N73_02260 [Lachnospiraceae bacterium]|nr:hypothetical protein [Lachnospiraceae bacterium]